MYMTSPVLNDTIINIGDILNGVGCSYKSFLIYTYICHCFEKLDRIEFTNIQKLVKDCFNFTNERNR